MWSWLCCELGASSIRSRIPPSSIYAQAQFELTLETQEFLITGSNCASH
jgi:hypothetical protein